MAKDKIDHLTELVKLGFANLDTRIERGFAALADDIDDLDHKIMSLRATTETGFLSLREEIPRLQFPGPSVPPCSQPSRTSLGWH